MRLKPSFPLFALFGITRGMAGIGLGMLLADRIAARNRRAIGKVLFGIGAASTVPLIAALVRRSRMHVEAGGVMEPMTQAYTPQSGVVDDAEILTPPGGAPEAWPR
jgi:hypothetical protein